MLELLEELQPDIFDPACSLRFRLITGLSELRRPVQLRRLAQSRPQCLTMWACCLGSDACWNFFRPSVLTRLPSMWNSSSFSRSFRCSNPASVTCVCPMSRRRRLVSLSRCFSPASVIRVSRRKRASSPGQPFKVFQPGVGDLAAFQAQHAEMRHALQVLQSGVGDLAAVEVQVLELGQILEVLQSGVGYLIAGEAQRSDAGQLSQSFQLGVRDFRLAEIHIDAGMWVQPVARHHKAAQFPLDDLHRLFALRKPVSHSSSARRFGCSANGGVAVAGSVVPHEQQARARVRMPTSLPGFHGLVTQKRPYNPEQFAWSYKLDAGRGKMFPVCVSYMKFSRAGPSIRNI